MPIIDFSRRRSSTTKKLLTIVAIMVMAVLGGCASTARQDTRAQTTTQFLGQQRPAF
jgi:hypothetical protein